MRNVKKYGSYKNSPYKREKEGYSATIFQPDEFTLSLLMSLSPKALRVLLVIAARVDPSTGISYSPTKELRQFFPGALPNLSTAKTELLQTDLVAYAHANHSFYVNPKAFKIVALAF